jgi:hypothetical protein
MKAEERWKRINLENHRHETEKENLEKYLHHSTIEVEDEYKLKLDEKEREEEKYKT